MPSGATWSEKKEISWEDDWVTVFTRFTIYPNPIECLEIKTDPGGKEWRWRVIGPLPPWSPEGTESGYGCLPIGWAFPFVEVKIRTIKTKEDRFPKWEYQRRHKTAP